MTISDGGGPTGEPIMPAFQRLAMANSAETAIDSKRKSSAMANRTHGSCCAALALCVLGDQVMARQAAAACDQHTITE